jgi:hypothetical protein
MEFSQQDYSSEEKIVVWIVCDIKWLLNGSEPFLKDF